VHKQLYVVIQCCLTTNDSSTVTARVVKLTDKSCHITAVSGNLGAASQPGGK